jgi:hypothetical protein
MNQWLTKDWVTTVIGLAAAVLNLVANGTSVKNALLSLAFAALGKTAAVSK